MSTKFYPASFLAAMLFFDSGSGGAIRVQRFSISESLETHYSAAQEALAEPAVWDIQSIAPAAAVEVRREVAELDNQWKRLSEARLIVVLGPDGTSNGELSQFISEKLKEKQPRNQFQILGARHRLASVVGLAQRFLRGDVLERRERPDINFDLIEAVPRAEHGVNQFGTPTAIAILNRLLSKHDPFRQSNRLILSGFPRTIEDLKALQDGALRIGSSGDPITIDVAIILEDFLSWEELYKKISRHGDEDEEARRLFNRDMDRYDEQTRPILEELTDVIPWVIRVKTFTEDLPKKHKARQTAIASRFEKTLLAQTPAAQARLELDLQIQNIRQLRDHGEPDKAIAELKKLPESYHQNEIIQQLFASCLYRVGNYPAVLHWTGQILEANPANVVALVLAGRASERLHDYKKAALFMERAAKEHPNNLKTQRTLAFIYRRAQQYEKARRLENQVVANAPTSVPALLIQAYGLLDDGLVRHAIEKAADALIFDEDNVEARTLIVRALRQQGEGQAALTEAAMLVEGHSRDAKLWRRLSEVYSAIGNVQAAIQAIQQAIALDPIDAWLRFALVRHRLDAGQIPEALLEAERTTMQFPAHIALREKLELLFDRIGLSAAMGTRPPGNVPPDEILIRQSN
jgi:tetratricopeptide (TPR) repeat protein